MAIGPKIPQMCRPVFTPVLISAGPEACGNINYAAELARPFYTSRKELARPDCAPFVRKFSAETRDRLYSVLEATGQARHRAVLAILILVACACSCLSDTFLSECK